jgi:DNA processing protein
MTMFGLKEAEIATLVRAVAGDELDREAIRDRFARGTWTGIAEPGDRTAGLVVESLGAAAALDALLSRWTSSRWADAVKAAGRDDFGRTEFDLAVERWTPRMQSASALLAFRQASRFGARLMIRGDAGWPAGVDDLEVHGPTALWARGTDDALAALESSIALVGARAATGYGEHVAMEASAGLVDRGYAIVSGAAYGIDGMAHRAALASHGKTVAFLAGGVDRFYPSGHDSLLTRIVEEGAVVSELPCGQPPTRWRFLQRNRLIAAASQATIVLEAGWRSGSLNTAGHAKQLGRPVGAVPGPVTNAASAGCHRLIREFNAELVTTAAEMAELAPLHIAGAGASPAPRTVGRDDSAEGQRAARTAQAHESPEATRLLDALSSRSARASSDIAARSGLSIAAVQALLGSLELDGAVARGERGWRRVGARTQ